MWPGCRCCTPKDCARVRSGAGGPLRRVTRRRASLVQRRTAVMARLDALVELLGPAWHDVLASDYEKTAIAVLTHFPDPLDCYGWERHGWTLSCASTPAAAGPSQADALRAAARDRSAVGRRDGIRGAGRRHPRRGGPVPVPRRQIGQADARIAALVAERDPAGILTSPPGSDRS